MKAAEEFQYAAAMGQIPQETADYLAAGINAAELDKEDLPPLQWAVHHVIAQGLNLLAGAPKTGKSWFVLAIALAIASGGKALGRIDVDRRPVLYLALEDGRRRLQQRVRDLLRGQPVPDGLTFQITPPEGGKLALFVALDAWYHHHPDGLVIVDTLGVIKPPGKPSETQYSAEYAFMRELGAVVGKYDTTGAAMIVVHHTRKAAALDVFDTVSGSTALTGAVDSTLILTRPRGEDAGVLEVTGRDVPEGSYALVSKTLGSWELDGRDLAAAAIRADQVKATAGVGDRMAEVVDYVNRSDKPVRAADVAEALGIDKDQAGVYLRRAAEAERIGKNSRGLYSPVRSVWSVRNGQGTPNTSNTTNTPPLRDCQVCGERLDPIWAEVGSHPACLDGAA